MANVMFFHIYIFFKYVYSMSYSFWGSYESNNSLIDEYVMRSKQIKSQKNTIKTEKTKISDNYCLNFENPIQNAKFKIRHVQKTNHNTSQNYFSELEKSLMSNESKSALSVRSELSHSVSKTQNDIVDDKCLDMPVSTKKQEKSFSQKETVFHDVGDSKKMRFTCDVEEKLQQDPTCTVQSEQTSDQRRKKQKDYLCENKKSEQLDYEKLSNFESKKNENYQSLNESHISDLASSFSNQNATTENREKIIIQSYFKNIYMKEWFNYPNSYFVNTNINPFNIDNTGESYKQTKINSANSTHMDNIELSTEEKSNSFHELQNMKFEGMEELLILNDNLSSFDTNESFLLNHIQQVENNPIENTNSLTQNKFNKKDISDIELTTLQSESEITISNSFEHTDQYQIESIYVQDNSNTNFSDLKLKDTNKKKQQSIESNKINLDNYNSKFQITNSTSPSDMQKANIIFEKNSAEFWLCSFPKIKKFNKEYDTYEDLCSEFHLVCDTIASTYRIAKKSAHFLLVYLKIDCFTQEFSENCYMRINSTLNMSFEGLKKIYDILIESHQKNLNILQQIFKFDNYGSDKYESILQKLYYKKLYENAFYKVYKNGIDGKLTLFSNFRRVAEQALNFSEDDDETQERNESQISIDNEIFKVYNKVIRYSDLDKNDSTNYSGYLLLLLRKKI